MRPTLTKRLPDVTPLLSRNHVPFQTQGTLRMKQALGANELRDKLRRQQGMLTFSHGLPL
jgi:hypothetical protein